MHEGGHTTHVVKNYFRHTDELFDAEKLHKSVVSACLSSGAPVGNAENTARRVVSDVLQWLKDKPEITSSDIRRATAKFLRTYHPDASYLYEHHGSIL